MPALSNLIPDPLHPAIVHFPVALAVILPLFALGALWSIRKGAKPIRAWGVTAVLLAFVALGAVAAVQTGGQQAERVENTVGEAAVDQHEEAAELFEVSAIAVLVIGLVGLRSGKIGQVGRLAATIGTLVLFGMVWNVGHTGGRLVYGPGTALNAAGGAGAGGGEAGEDGERGGR